MKLEKLAQDIKLVDSDIEIAEKTIASAKEQAQREQEIAQEKLAILGTTLSTSVRYAYDNLVDVFFDGSYTRQKLTQNLLFGSRDSAGRNRFGSSFQKVYRDINELQTMDDETLNAYAKLMVETLDK